MSIDIGGGGLGAVYLGDTLIAGGGGGGGGDYSCFPHASVNGIASSGVGLYVCGFKNFGGNCFGEVLFSIVGRGAYECRYFGSMAALMVYAPDKGVKTISNLCCLSNVNLVSNYYFCIYANESRHIYYPVLVSGNCKYTFGCLCYDSFCYCNCTLCYAPSGATPLDTITTQSSDGIKGYVCYYSCSQAYGAYIYLGGAG